MVQVATPEALVVPVQGCVPFSFSVTVSPGTGVFV